MARAQGPLEGNPLIEIPEGPFVFGSDAGEDNEAPAGAIDLAAFRITRSPFAMRS